MAINSGFQAIERIPLTAAINPHGVFSTTAAGSGNLPTIDGQAPGANSAFRTHFRHYRVGDIDDDYDHFSLRTDPIRGPGNTTPWISRFEVVLPATYAGHNQTASTDGDPLILSVSATYAKDALAVVGRATIDASFRLLNTNDTVGKFEGIDDNDTTYAVPSVIKATHDEVLPQDIGLWEFSNTVIQRNWLVRGIANERAKCLITFTMKITETSGEGSIVGSIHGLFLNGITDTTRYVLTPATDASILALDTTQNYLILDSRTGSFNVTLPVAPRDGDEIEFVDKYGACGTHPVTILGTINGIVNPTIGVNRATLKIKWDDATSTWGIV